MFENFFGNPATAAALERMIESGRIPQTLLLAGPDGVGKATLARRFAARLLGHADHIERDDLSREENVQVVASRERWPADKRNNDPLLFGSHPDFLTFPPDGPLRQLSIEQMRLMKERAPYKPMHGPRRVFLIDHVDRANEQAANSLLKTLEEPPPHLVIVMTAENAYDLLPTIRSRAVPFHLGPLANGEMRAFAEARKLEQAERRIALAQGSPGVALSLDLESYDRRCQAMLALLQAAAGLAPFAVWMKHSEAIGRSKNERLDLHLGVLTLLLRDILLLAHGVETIRNAALRQPLHALARKVPFAWLQRASQKVDELNGLVRRNIQKTIALDALIMDLAANGRE